ncbi:hypothetical protein N1F78_11580 [Seonamhaeicola sp. MEBiC1930]|uniref:hypothetical protein n=1 Tax=Seonamhaeicola sp. MEBiC01930 TaxID=2976768 RepID=UPI00324FCEC8
MKTKLYRNKEFNVDLFSDIDLFDNPIEPLKGINVLLKAKPVTQTSSWEVSDEFDEKLDAVTEGLFDKGTSAYYVFNPLVNLTSANIEGSLAFFQNFQGGLSNKTSDLGDDFIIIEAQNNLRKVKVDISELDFQMNTDVDNGGDGYIDFELVLKYGPVFETATKQVFHKDFVREHQSYSHSDDYSFTIPFLTRGEYVWLYYDVKVRQSSTKTIPGVNPKFEAFITVNSMNVDVTASSIAYNTIAPSIRLKDGVSQVVKSLSGLETSFPFAELNGEMYNQRIFSGNLLRNLTDQPFIISLKDIEEWLPEIYGDYEVQDDGTVFFGKYEDFYQKEEIGVFTDVRFDSYKKYFNPRYAINQFKYKYKKYQSQKESEVENTFDIAHGETQWRVMNDSVENTKECNISFVRCSFYLDEQRRKAFDLDDNTATQDDDTIFILDTKEATNDSEFTETDYLQHTYNEETGYLKLTNTGSFNFILLGLAVGDPFIILDDANEGHYEIIEVTDRYIIIDAQTGDTSNNGDRTTQFTYIVSKTTAPFISWSSEGFNYIDGIVDSDNFANLKYTIKRNVVRFYNQYLSTCNQFSKKAIKNTLYNNNGTLSLGYDGIQTIENEDFTPSEQILSPYMHDITIITDFNTFIGLQKQMKLQRGYIRSYDAKGHVIKIYPQEMTFQNTGNLGELNIIGEEKYNPSLINIIYSGSGYVVINNEYRLQKITYKIDNENIHLMDQSGLLLYNPLSWNKITMNDVLATSKEELIEWFEQIT